MRAAPPLIALTLCLAGPAPGAAKEAFEGVWARTRAECRDTDLPTSRTYISLSARETGPILDQYENHCRIGEVRRAGGAVRLSLTCHEFWDDFRARRSGRRVQAVLRVAGRDAISIDGKAYRRCAR